MNLYKILKYVAALIGVIGVALMIWLLSVGPDDFKGSADLQESILNPYVFIAYLILGLAIVSVIVFTVMKLIDGGGVKQTLMSLGAFVVVFLISFLAASSKEISYPNGSHISASGAKWMNTGINMLYILLILAIVVMVVSSVRNLTYRK